MAVRGKSKQKTSVVYEVIDEPVPKLRDHTTWEYNANDFAAIVGVSVPTLSNWQLEGMPPPHKPARNIAYYDLRTHLPWIRDNKWKPSQTAKARKMEAESDLAEMKRDEAAGILINANTVLRQWEDYLARLRTNLRGFPARLIPLLDEVKTEREKLAIGQNEMDKVLNELVEKEQA